MCTIAGSLFQLRADHSLIRPLSSSAAQDDEILTEKGKEKKVGSCNELSKSTRARVHRSHSADPGYFRRGRRRQEKKEAGLTGKARRCPARAARNV